jgi:hypothetical protein
VEKPRKTYLYRYFDASGVLLYVGATWSPAQRDRAHAKDAHWYSLVVSTAIEVYPSIEAAAEAEENAIINEKPLFNKREDGGVGLRKDREQSTVISLRVSMTEANALDAAAKRLGINRTGMLRRLLRNLK